MRRLAQPDPSDVVVETVYCFGCGRTVGVNAQDAPRQMTVFCEELCWHLEQLVSLEHAARDRVIRMLAEHGVAQSEIARLFGLTRPRVHQVLAQDNDEDYLLAGRRKPLTPKARAQKSRAGKLGGPERWKK